jgi:hypothetical protein
LAPSPMISPARHDQALPVIGGRPLRLPHRYRREMRTGNGLTLVLRYVSTITTTGLAQPRLRFEARWANMAKTDSVG